MANYSKITDKSNGNRPIQVESAVRDGKGKNIVNNYAKQTGNYQTMSVGEATDLSTTRVIDNPEESCPPIVMGVTGGNAEIRNGLQKFQYMEGNSVVFNQLVRNGDFSNGWNDGWGANAGMTVSVSNGICTFTAISRYQNISQTISYVSGHKYYAETKIKLTTGSTNVVLQMGIGAGNYLYTGSQNTTNWQVISEIKTAPTTIANGNVVVQDNRESGWDAIQVDYVMCIDLTLIYGAGNEPTTVAEFKSRFPLDYYAYNAGTILSAKTNALISRGRQQWDEEWELGVFSANGQPFDSDQRIRTKNFIPVIENQDYYISVLNYTGSLGTIMCYDINKNVIDIQYPPANSVITTPQSCSFIKIAFYLDYGNTYNHDITISIYFEDGEGYDQYYPYEAQTVELPNIELRAIGDIKDIAYASGGGKRRIGIVDLGSLNWVKTNTNTTDVWRFYAIISDLKTVPSPYDVGNVLCSKYKNVSNADTYQLVEGCAVHQTGENSINIYDSRFANSTANQFKTAMSGVYLLYELATEEELTENEGWVENVIVDNYGTLEFVTDPQQIPQVKQPYFIEYTISLKEFLDGTYQRASGNPQNIALIEDVEQLKQNIEDGQVVAGKSLVTEQIENISEESGSIQSEPFVYQGTGTNNGSDIVDTSPVAKQLEKQGNSVVVNQPVQSPNFSDSSKWNFQNATGSISNNVATWTATQQNGNINSNFSINIIDKHKYLCVCDVKLTTGSTNICLELRDGTFAQHVVYTKNTNDRQLVVGIATAQASYQYGYVRLIDYRPSGWDAISVYSFNLIDLTQWFGSNDAIPQDLLDHPENFFRYYNGSLAYNTGTLVDSDGQYLECGQSRNVWDEEWENGYYNANTGATVADNNYIRSKNANPIRVNPDTYYHFYCGSTVSNANAVVLFYDKDGNFISSFYPTMNLNFKTPSNCIFVKFYMYTAYGSTYNHDITISLYYTPQQGGEGYDQYYPYIAPKVYDTGVETLRSAGSIKDYKTPDGTIHRLVGVVDLGTLEWNYNQNDGQWCFSINASSIGIISTSYSASNSNLCCSKYTSTSWNNNRTLSGFDKTIAQGGKFISIRDSAYTDAVTFKTSLSGVMLYYELAEETTEEGTPFAENIEINDYSYMAWKNADGYVEIPQGCKIFYPADYVLFIDSLYSRSKDGGESADVNNFVLQSERTADKTAQATLDSQLKEALGGTLRQLLAVSQSVDFANTAFVDLGELNWSYDGTNAKFVVYNVGSKKNSITILSTLYKTVSPVYASTAQDNMTVATRPDYDGTIYFKNTAYTDTTTFKNAMKGVLLAYEKAS